MERLSYDRTNPISIEKYAQWLIGKSFREIFNANIVALAENLSDKSIDELSDIVEQKKNKGNLGQIVEEQFFHYKRNNDSRADFHEAGVELKVTPYRKKKNGSFSAKERLILTMIDYLKITDEENFEQSHLWKKCKLILLVWYLYEKQIKMNIDYRIGYVGLFTPPTEDIEIMKQDYECILSKIRMGKAHELSEADTLYLSAAPKASSSKDRRKQPFSNELAKPRAFAFKASYMTYVLNHYVIPKKSTYEAIVVGNIGDSFEAYVVKKISQYRSCSVQDLCEKFDIKIQKRPKNLEAMLAYRMLGIKGNHAEEFEKANVVAKTIRIESNNKIKQSMSFPAFKFKKLIEEDWEDSTFGNYLRETRFLFVVYKFDEQGILRLRGCQFWNIPYNDLETEVKSVWEKAKEVIENGLQISKVNGKYQSNLPKSTENKVSHVRPHGRNSDDMDELPDGRNFPKQCFWLNNTYIYEQINNELKLDPNKNL